MSETTSKINVYINGSEAAKSLKELTKESEKLQKELTEMTAGTKEFAEKSKELQKVEAAVQKMSKQYTELEKSAGGGLDVLVAKQRDLQTELAKPDLTAAKRKELLADLAATNLAYSQMDKILNGVKQEGVTIQQLSEYQKKLTKEINNTVLSETEYQKKVTELHQVNAILDEHRNRLRGVNTEIQNQTAQLQPVQSAWQSFRAMASASAVGNIVSEGAVGALDMLKTRLVATKQAVIDYQQALSELKAVTGVSGAELQGLESRAASLTSIVTQSGQTISNKATDILKAFQLVGSAKPELLKDAEGMEMVTKEAIMLAQAAKMTVPDAINVLTTTMEQFGAPAAQAGRYINAMAAGAKEGSVSIEESSKATQKFGAVAKSMNVTIEESTALVQVLGKTFTSGEEAGTALRNILSKIQTPQNLSKEALEGLKHYHVNLERLKDPTIALSERLKELTKIQADAGVMGKVFGDENIVAGRIVLENVEKFKTLTTAVTGTSEAYVQADAMSDNLGNDLKTLENEVDKATQSLALGLAPSMRTVTQAFTDGLRWIQSNADALKWWAEGIIAATFAVGSYYATVKVLPAVMELWAKRTVASAAVQSAYSTILALFSGQVTLASVRIGIASAATAVWNTILKANPVGLVVSGIVALVGAITLVTAKIRENASESVRLKTITHDLNGQLNEEKVKREHLFQALKDATTSREGKTAAIRKLNDLYPNILKKYDLEKASLGDLTKIENELNASIERRIATEMRDAATSELRKQKAKMMTELTTLQDASNSPNRTATGVDGDNVDSNSQNLSDIIAQQEKIKKIDAQITSTESLYGRTFGLDKKETSSKTPEKEQPKVPKHKDYDADADKDAKEKSDKASKVASQAQLGLEKFKEKITSFDNDIEQLAAKKELSDELRIKEKYNTEIKELQDFGKKFPNEKAKVAELEKQMTLQMGKELIALRVHQLNETEKFLKVESDKASELRLSEEAKEKLHVENHFREKLTQLRKLTSDESNLPLAEKQRAKEQLLAIEAAQSEQLLKISRKYRNIEEKESQEFLSKRLKEKQDAEKRIKGELSKPTKKGEKNDTTVQFLADLKSTQHLERAQLKAHFEELLALADEYGLDTKQLKAKQLDEESALDKAFQDKATERQVQDNSKKLSAYGELFKGLGDIASAAAELIGQQGEKQSSFQKVLTLAQIAMDTASAISALMAHSEKNPTNAATMGIAGTIQFATGLARILSNVARARKVFAEAPVVQKERGGYSNDTVTGATDGKLYKVRYMARPQTGYTPAAPTVYPSASGHDVLVGEGNKKEYIIDHPTSQIPVVMDMIRTIENIKQHKNPTIPMYVGGTMQRKDGGFTDESTSYPTKKPMSLTNDNDSLDSTFMRELSHELKRLNDNLDKGIVSIIPDDTIQALFRRIERMRKASGRQDLG